MLVIGEFSTACFVTKMPCVIIWMRMSDMVKLLWHESQEAASDLMIGLSLQDSTIAQD